MEKLGKISFNDPPSYFPVILGRDADLLIKNGCPVRVPWSFVAPHADRAMKNHNQTLERLAERGGLSPSELVVLVKDLSLKEVFLTVELNWVKELLTLLESHN